MLRNFPTTSKVGAGKWFHLMCALDASATATTSSGNVIKTWVNGESQTLDASNEPAIAD
jgi:hypothetical protein